MSALLCSVLMLRLTCSSVEDAHMYRNEYNWNNKRLKDNLRRTHATKKLQLNYLYFKYSSVVVVV